MKLSSLLAFINKIADEKKLSSIFVVGGIPRDKVVGKIHNFNDIDLTTIPMIGLIFKTCST